jgi:hypothetical protein
MAEPVAIVPDKSNRPGVNVSGSIIPTRRFVNLATGTSPFSVALSTAGALAYGVSETELALGGQGSIQLLGVAVVEAGGAVSRGAAVQSDALGRAVTSAGGAILGRCLTPTASAGDFMMVELTGYAFNVLAGPSADFSVVEVSADPTPSVATLEASITTFACDVSVAGFAVTLPNPEPTAGVTVNVKDAFNGGTQAGVNNITVDAQVGGDIDGSQTEVIAVDFGSLSLQSRGPGNGWMIL